MELTKRRMQFLRKLLDIYQQTHLPIHYEMLAQTLGVSKWTAYDMLQEIEKLGYLTRDYVIHSGEAGRSQVVFLPTDKTVTLFEQQRTEAMDPEEWQKTKTTIITFLHSLKHNNINDALQGMIEEAAKAKTRINFCASIIGMHLLYLSKLDRRTQSLVKLLVQEAPTDEIGMTMFVGAVIGTALQTASREIGDETTKLVVRYLKSMTELSERERGMLFELLQEALV